MDGYKWRLEPDEDFHLQSFYLKLLEGLKLSKYQRKMAVPFRGREIWHL